MKRYNHLYENICKYENIESAFLEVRKNTRNKRRVFNMKQHKSYYIASVYNIVIHEKYIVGEYIKFVIKEPKERVIVSQNIIDKIVNHLVARFILYPALLPCLLDVNVASRKQLGTSAGINIFKNYKRVCDVKYGKYYILKCDISKFFASINHEILKEKLKRKIKDTKALKIVFDIIDSNSPGLFIGSMTSQILAIFYLNDLDHYIKEVLKINYYVRYQDDFMLFHPSKEYLTHCLKQISKFLEKEKLTLNDKTRIYKSSDNFTFLGRNKKYRYIRYRNVKRKLKYRHYHYKQSNISLSEFVASVNCYVDLIKKKPSELINPD